MFKSDLSLLALAGSLVAGHALAGASPEASLLAHAKVSKEHAAQIALAHVPHGKVQSAELEREQGKLIWSFDLARRGQGGVTEVQVDAVSGKVVSTKRESAANEAAESRAEAREMRHDPSPRRGASVR